jgi:predicted secreted acid phosphatase
MFRNTDSYPYMGWQINYAPEFQTPDWGPWEAHNPHTGEILGAADYAGICVVVQSVGRAD